MRARGQGAAPSESSVAPSVLPAIKKPNPVSLNVHSQHQNPSTVYNQSKLYSQPIKAPPKAKYNLEDDFDIDAFIDDPGKFLPKLSREKSRKTSKKSKMDTVSNNNLHLPAHYSKVDMPRQYYSE